MHRSLKELLIDDYLDFDDNNDDNDNDNISISLDNEQHIYYNVIHHKKTSKDYLREIFHHPIYDYFMAFVVISSSITLGLSLETDENYIKNSYRQKFIYAFDEILIAILFLEFIFKIYLESIHYWFNWTNIYDFIIILFGFIEIIWNLFFQKTNSTITNLLKGFRLLQLIRLYRIIKLSEGLQVLTQALIKTVLTYTFSVVILVFLFIYVVAVIGQMLYGKPEDSPWHHFPTSLIIAMRLTLVDNWNLIGPELEEKGSPSISRWFLTIIVFVGNRIVTNVLVGLMIESVSSVNDDYIKEKRQKKNLRNQKKREELSKRTIQVLNTRVSDTNNKMNTTENTIEQIKAKLKLFHNEIIIPKDFIFSINWLEKLVICSEKSHNEGKSARHLIIHLIQSLSDIIDENMKRNK
ncbi:unnamed protein product [Rotaria sordida]|uniref:Ion transport domain-containing protein n=1 Tax=Rotaria sordida TaxID=392033 RepID=A0A819LVD7_9BILA|nr:unnamed protein product [Rotaria sordida]CAF3967050.1 unnamed protein product [Rotaria sordida]